MTRGVLTIATGAEKYIAMAKALGISLALHSPETPAAIVTDSRDPELARLFRHIIRPPQDCDGFRLKTILPDLSPFDRTIFADADCLFVGPAERMFSACGERDFVVLGRSISSGYWFTDIPELLRKIGRQTLPSFNSGFIYFKKNALTARIFSEAQQVFLRREYFGIEKFKGSCPDEPCLAVGMALAGVGCSPDPDRCLAATPIGLVGKFRVDAIRGGAEWTLAGVGLVRPTLVHFVSRTNGPEYITECVRLRLHWAGGWRRRLMPLIGAAVYSLMWLRRLPGDIYRRHLSRRK